MQLVSDWKNFHKWWSTWFQAAAALFFSYLTAVPDAAIHIWTVLPDDVRSSFPPGYLKWAGVACIVAGILARVVKQPRLSTGVGPERERRVSRKGLRDMPGPGA
jgi:hypothetical protein